MRRRIRYGRLTAVLAASALLVLAVRLALTSPAPARTPEAALSSAALPVSDGDLAVTGRLAAQWVSAYGSFRYDEPPATYLARLAPITAPALLTQLRQGAQDQALLQERRTDHAVATATATTRALLSASAATVTYQVEGHQHTDTIGQPVDDTQTFTVTLTRNGTSWLVTTAQPDAGAPP